MTTWLHLLWFNHISHWIWMKVIFYHKIAILKWSQRKWVSWSVERKFDKTWKASVDISTSSRRGNFTHSTTHATQFSKFNKKHSIQRENESIILAKYGNFIPNHKIRNFVIKLLWESFQFPKYSYVVFVWMNEWLCFVHCCCCVLKTRKLLLCILKNLDWNEKKNTLNLQQNTKHFFHDSIHFFSIWSELVRY